LGINYLTEELKNYINNDLSLEIIELIKKYSGVIAGGYLRDHILDLNPRDLDLFFININDWNNFNDEVLLLKGVKKVEFLSKKVLDSKPKLNVKKFSYNGIEMDSIYYLHVQKEEHITETFDFTCNMIMYDPLEEKLTGSLSYDLNIVLNHILERSLIVGDNLWFKATRTRALTRYDKFVNEKGFTMDDENKLKYKYYIENLM